MGLSCRRLPLRGVGIVVVLLLALAVFAAPAGATPPGANGKIAFYRVIKPGTVLGIYTINPDGTGETFVAGTGDNSATCSFLDCHSAGFDPAWSPDGTTIAFDRAEASYHRNPPGCCGVRKIWSVAATGGGDKPLVCEDLYPFSNYQCLGWEFQPAFSPDGTQIAYASDECVGTPPSCTEGGSFSIWVMPAAGTGCTPPTPAGWDTWVDTPCGAEADVSGGLAPPTSLAPAWSPDGTRIAYMNNSAVWVMDADGSNQHQLIEGPAYNPDWSPDGQEIVYSDGLNLFIYHLSDGSATQLTFGFPSVQDDEPVFSPDSTEIAFERKDFNLGPEFQICTVRVDGSNLQRVTNSLPADDFSPSWQPVPLGHAVAPATGAPAPCGPTAPAGKIVVSKVTAPNPDPSSATFQFSEGGGLSGSFGLKNGGSQTIADVPVGSGYSITESAQSGWDQTGATCSHGTPANVTVSPGETVTCTFTNTQRGVAKVLKTVSGSPVTTLLPPAQQSFTFQLRSGASTTNAGMSLAQQNATAANGGVFTFAARLVAGSTYQLCEIVMPGWRTTLGPTPFVLYDPSGDNSTLCANFSVSPGETKSIAVDNRPPPGGLARTIGFWKNWASCASSSGNQKPVLDQTLAAADPAGISIGMLTVHAGDCLKAVRLLNKSTIDTGKKMSSDPAFNLAAELLAAKLNLKAGALTCPSATNAISDAQALLAAVHFNGITHDKLSAAQATQANSLATTLDHFNNNVLC
jgi:Tol biopolymer transport system component